MRLFAMNVDYRQFTKLILIIVCTMVFYACIKNPFNKTSSSPGTDDNTKTSGPPEDPPATYSTSVVDYGQKSTVAGSLRGVSSDVKIIPGAGGYPVAAFTDTSNSVVKLSYWDGSKYNIETIAGDSAANYVRLVIRSNNIPYVFWTAGTQVRVGIRSQALTQAGTATWTVGSIDTGVAPRAIEVDVNPLDDIGLVFLTDTAATGRAKFVYCSGSCTLPADFLPMTPNPYIEATNLTGANTSVGFSWCKLSATTYYPAAVYGLAAATRYAVCANSLVNCRSNASWTTQSVVAATAVGAKLYLDSAVTNDVPKVIRFTGTNITTYKMGVSSCSTPAAFSAGATLGAATSGSLWMKLLKDSTGYFHVLANEGTASVRYYNNANTDVTLGWNPVGIVETVTLSAGQVGSATLDSVNGNIYTSYNQASNSYEYRLGKNSSLATASNSAVFSKVDIDLSGSIMQTTANSQRRTTSIAKAPSGHIGVAYVDFSIAGTANARLRYAYKTSVYHASTSWVTNDLPDTNSPQYPSIIFDHDNKPWISYFEAGINRFVLQTNSSSDGSGSWHKYEFPSVPGGAPVALPAANETALGIYTNAGISSPVMAIIDTNAGSKGVKAAKLDWTTRAWSTVATIDGLAAGALGASHLTLDWTVAGELALAFYDRNLTQLKYSASTNGTSWTASYLLTAAGIGVGASIQIFSGTLSPAVSYFDKANNTVYYNPCSGSVSSCATSGWSPVSVATGVGISGLGAQNEQVLKTSLHLGTSSIATIVYPSGQAGTGNLTQVTNSSGSFTSPTTYYAGASGNLSGSAALNFGVSGWDLSGVKNVFGKYAAVWIGPGNWLYFTNHGY